MIGLYLETFDASSAGFFVDASAVIALGETTSDAATMQKELKIEEGMIKDSFDEAKKEKWMQWFMVRTL